MLHTIKHKEKGCLIFFGYQTENKKTDKDKSKKTKQSLHDKKQKKYIIIVINLQNKDLSLYYKKKIIYIKTPYMKKFITHSLLFSIVLLSFFWTTKTNAANGTVSLEIKRGYLTIAGSWSLQIGNINNNPSGEERIIGFNDIFQVRDISWLCGGYYTTIQIGDIKSTTSSIENNALLVQGYSVTTLWGRTNPSIFLWNNIWSQLTQAIQPITYLYRNSNTDCWNIGQYWSTWDIKISIPANQESGIYRGKIYYLLIDNN